MEPIEDHGVIGDCRSAALVSRSGAVDWLCWPRFDSPSIFGALLDDAAGAWVLCPVGGGRGSQRYVPGTNVLETRFTMPTGVLCVTDFMPVASEEDKRGVLFPEHELVRLVRCESGAVELAMRFAPRPDYARRRPRFRDAGRLGMRVQTRQGLLVLRTTLPLTPVGDGLCARVRLVAGETHALSLTLAERDLAVLPPLGDWTLEALDRTVRWWRGWLSQLRYRGPFADAVARSALALKLLAFAPSGAVVAAATTSLPERPGGDLNWDYRFAWLRDASMTVRALFGLGFFDEASAFVSWLLHATRLTQPELRVLYDIYGRRPPKERRLDHLSGHFGARPVRIGNAAADQLQLDIYGEVIDATAQFVRRGGKIDRETQEMLAAFGLYVCRHWQLPDEGIWEPRSGVRENTHSRLLCWTALDRLLSLHRTGCLPRIPAEHFAEARARIRAEIERRAWNPRLQSYVATLDGEALDASTLLLPWYRFEAASSERMRKTYARIRERLGAGGGRLYRYRSPDSPGEGAFGICGFWAAELLARGGGTLDEAVDLLGALCGDANEVGLFAEEIDPATGAALGNFPQAFTHVGLINAALTLERRLRREAWRRRAAPARAVEARP